MKTQTMKSNVILTLCALSVLGPTQAFGGAETIARTGPPAGPAPDSANFSTGFELFGTGLYWWQGYGVCGEGLPNKSEIGFKGFASASTLPSLPVLACTSVIEAAARA